MVSRVDPPVVSTSSTTSTRSLAASVKPRRSVSTPVLPLGENGAHAQRTADFVSDHDAAKRRRQHDGRAQRARAVGDGPAERFGRLRMLQHERALQVARAVQPGGEAEVALEQRT